jgi:hypothetical protein
MEVVLSPICLSFLGMVIGFGSPDKISRIVRPRGRERRGEGNPGEASVIQ